MAKALFFVELLVGLVLLPFGPGIDHAYSALGVALLVLIVILTLGAVVAVHGVRPVFQALSDAWQLVPRNAASAAVWSRISAVFPIAGALGGAVILVAALDRFDVAQPAWTQGLTLGTFCLIWGFLGALVGQILHKIVARLRNPRPMMVLDQTFGVKYGLTPRELAAAQGVLDGLTYKDTATRLFISPTTVKSHILSVYQKTGAGNKIELLRLVEAETQRIHQTVHGPQAPEPPS